MTVIEFIRDWLSNSELMSEFDQNYDFFEFASGKAGLLSSGTNKMGEDILGNETYQANFTLFSSMNAYTDYNRLNNSDFLTRLFYSLNQIKNEEITETINNEDKKGLITSVVSSNAMLLEVPTGDINDGVKYQLQIQVNYKIFA